MEYFVLLCIPCISDVGVGRGWVPCSSTCVSSMNSGYQFATKRRQRIRREMAGGETRENHPSNCCWVTHCQAEARDKSTTQLPWIKSQNCNACSSQSINHLWFIVRNLKTRMFLKVFFLSELDTVAAPSCWTTVTTGTQLLLSGSEKNSIFLLNVTNVKFYWKFQL